MVPERDALAPDERIDPRWVSFLLISKTALADLSMPLWLRWLQPLLSGVFTVDNLDYVRRDSYMIGVSPARWTWRGSAATALSGRGLSLYEPGLGALEMFLTARLFMYQQIYFHRSVRAIDRDMAEVFPARACRRSSVSLSRRRPGPLRGPDEYALLHQAALWARGEAISENPAHGDGTVTSVTGQTLARDPVGVQTALARQR